MSRFKPSEHVLCPHQAADSSYLQTLVYLALNKASVQDLMNRDFQVVFPTATLRELLESFPNTRSFIIERRGNYIGLIDTRIIGKIGRDVLDKPATEFLIPVNRGNIVKRTEPALTAAEKLNRSNVLMVTDNDVAAGTISRFDLILFIKKRSPP